MPSLPAPAIIEDLNYEEILTELKNDLVSRLPSIAPELTLESSAVTKQLEVYAERETTASTTATKSTYTTPTPSTKTPTTAAYPTAKRSNAEWTPSIPPTTATASRG